MISLYLNDLFRQLPRPDTHRQRLRRRRIALKSSQFSQSRQIESLEVRALLTDPTPMILSGTFYADDFILRRDAEGDIIELLNADTGEIEASQLMADTSGIIINTLGGNDRLTIDESNGLIDVPDGIKFDGGSGDNFLIFKGIAQVDSFFRPITGTSAASLQHDANGALQFVEATRVSSVIDIVPGLISIDAGDLDSDITLDAGQFSGTATVSGITTGRVRAIGETTLEFGRKTNIAVNASNGADQVRWHANFAGFSGGLSIDGGSGNNSFTFVGTDESDTLIIAAEESTLNGRTVALSSFTEVFASLGAGADSVNVTPLDVPVSVDLGPDGISNVDSFFRGTGQNGALGTSGNERVDSFFLTAPLEIVTDTGLALLTPGFAPVFYSNTHNIQIAGQATGFASQGSEESDKFEVITIAPDERHQLRTIRNLVAGPVVVLPKNLPVHIYGGTGEDIFDSTSGEDSDEVTIDGNTIILNDMVYTLDLVEETRIQLGAGKDTAAVRQQQNRLRILGGQGSDNLFFSDFDGTASLNLDLFNQTLTSDTGSTHYDDFEDISLLSDSVRRLDIANTYPNGTVIRPTDDGEKLAVLEREAGGNLNVDSFFRMDSFFDIFVDLAIESGGSNPAEFHTGLKNNKLELNGSTVAFIDSFFRPIHLLNADAVTLSGGDVLNRVDSFFLTAPEISNVRIEGDGLDELNLNLSGSAHNIAISQTESGDLDISGLGGEAKIIGVLINRTALIGDGDDVARVDSFFRPSNPIRVFGDGSGVDTITGAVPSDVAFSGMSDVVVQPINGHGDLHFDIAGLSGSASYTGNLQQTDVATLNGSNVNDDGLLIGRYGNAWHPVGAQITQGGLNVRVAGAGRLEVLGGGGDDTLTIDVDQSRGSDVIGLPIYFDGGVGGFDTLRLIGNSPTAIQSTVYYLGLTPDAGQLDHYAPDGSLLMAIGFANLEPIIHEIDAYELAIAAGEDDNNIHFEASPGFATDRDGFVYVDRNEVIEVTNKETLVLRGSAGEDEYSLDLQQVTQVGNPFKRLRCIEIDDVGLRRGGLLRKLATIYDGRPNSLTISAVNALLLQTESGATPFGKLTLPKSSKGSGGNFDFEVFYKTGITDVLVQAVRASASLAVNGSSEQDILTLTAIGTAGEIDARLESTRSGVASVSLTGFDTLSFDLADGSDTVRIVGRDDSDSVIVQSASVTINGITRSISHHEIVRVNAGAGNDVVSVLEPIAASTGLPWIAVDAGNSGDFDVLRLVASAGVTGDIQYVVGAEGPSTGLLNTPLNPITFSGISRLDVDMSLQNRRVSVTADHADNAITLSDTSNAGSASALVAIHGRTDLQLNQLGPYSTLSLSGLGGTDTFSIDSPFAITVIEGGPPADRNQLIVSGTSGDDSFDYLPDAILPDAGFLAVNGRGIIFQQISEVTVDGLIGSDSLTALGGIGTSSRSFRTETPGESGSKIYATAVATKSTSGTDTTLRAFGSDRLTQIAGTDNDNSGPLNAAVIAGAPVEDSFFDVFFTVGSGDGQDISEFSLIGGVIAPSEFTTEDEPNNTAGDVTTQAFPPNGRIARSGAVAPLGGDIDLIAVVVGEQQRLAVIIENDPSNDGEFTGTNLRILGPDGESVIATGSNLAAPSNSVLTGFLSAGIYFVEVTNGSSSGDDDYCVVAFAIDDSQNTNSGPANNTPQTGISYTAPQFGRGRIGSNVQNDSVELTPHGNRESRLRFNNSSPLELIDFETVNVDPRDGLDQLNVIGTRNSDDFEFTGTNVMVNGQEFGHLNTELFATFADSGNDSITIRNSLAGLATVDGGDGDDMLTVDAAGGSAVGLALPNFIIDGRTIASLAVENFVLNAGGENIAVAGAPDAVSGLSATPTSANSVHLAGGGFGYDLTTTGTLTIGGAAPTAGSQRPLRHLDLHASIFDDTINATAAEINFDGTLKAIQLSDIPSVAITGGHGRDTFKVTPSATTEFFIDGGNPIGFGDSLYVTPVLATITQHAGPTNDSGGFEVSGMRSISYVHIESTVLPNRPIGIQPISPSRDGLPQLTWSTVIDVVSYEVELVNLSVVGGPQLHAVVDSFFQPAAPLELGQYEFRVRGVFEDGERTGFSEPVAFRVRTQSQFLNGSVTQNGLVEIQWTPVAGAVRYELLIDNYTTGERQFIHEQNLTETLYVPPVPLPIGQFVVWVKPYGATNFGGTWKGKSLRVNTPSIIVAPVGGTTGNAPAFEWTSVPGAETYDLWVRQLTPVRHDQIIRIQDLTSTTFTPSTPLPTGSFLFWVQAQGDNGFQSSWSLGARFNTFAPPTVQGPTSATSTVQSAIFWTPVTDASTYELEVTDSSGNVIIDQRNLAVARFTPSTPLEYGTEYHVRVRAVDGGGNPGVWSAVHQFATPPDRVQLINPGGEGSTGSLPVGPIQFSWIGVTGAAQYKLWVNKIEDSGPSVRVLYEPNLELTEYLTGTMEAGTYRFWVQAVSAEGRAGAWSYYYEFTIAVIQDSETNTNDSMDVFSRLAVLDEVMLTDAEFRNHDASTMENPVEPNDPGAEQSTSIQDDEMPLLALQKESHQLIDRIFESWN